MYYVDRAEDTTVIALSECMLITSAVLTAVCMCHALSKILHGMRDSKTLVLGTRFQVHDEKLEEGSLR